jgi:hypothetical protein
MVPCLSLVMLLSSRGPLPPTPTVGPTIKTAGKLGRHLVRHQVLLRRAAVRRCFDRYLTAKGPGIKVTFAIDGTGRVSVCNAAATPLDRCVARVVCGIRFPYAYDTLSDGSRRVTQQLTWVRYRFRYRPARMACGRACLMRLVDRALHMSKKKRLAFALRPRPTSNPTPQSRPTSNPAQSQPASRPATLPAPLPPPPVRRGGIPRIPLPQSDDPLEGIKLQKDPLDL